ncbi:hypothetical protein H4R24_005712 [Coemansia sp. RSA 988]|nr:hypothetical protein H4R24_005712 [Coemansia sp. RSA 988]
MRPTRTISISTLAFALTAQGSLLNKLLGNLNIQISACPEISINTSGNTAPGGKQQTQSSNPACPNYVPPGQAHIVNIDPSEQADLDQNSELSLLNPSPIMVSDAEKSVETTDEHKNLAPEAAAPQLETSSDMANSIEASISSMSIEYARTNQAPQAPVPQPDVTADPESQMPTPSYVLSPLSLMLPTPTNKEVLAEATVLTTASRAVDPRPTAVATTEPKKCAYHTQFPENTDVIIEGLPQIPSPSILPMQMPAISVPLWENPAWYQAAFPIQQQPQWQQPQLPQAEWEWFSTKTATLAPTISGEFFAKAAESTQTIYIPDGAEGVFFGTRNVGAFQFNS